jgi:hypothetical protein
LDGSNAISFIAPPDGRQTKMWRGRRIYLLQFKDGTWTDVLGWDLQHRQWWQIFMLSVLSIDPRKSLDSVEIVEAGEKVDSKER